MSNSWATASLGRAIVMVALAAGGCLGRFEVGTPSAQDSSSTRSGSETEGAGSEEVGTQQTGEGDGDAEGCGAACDPLVEICEGSDCGCRPGFVRCAGMCVDLRSDPEHCGSCSESCEGMQVCEQGECSEQGCAEEDATACEGACVELDSSPSHCGACGQPCLGDELCVGGQCLGYVFADCELDSQCGAGVCCELEGAGEGETVCVNGDQCP